VYYFSDEIEIQKDATAMKFSEFNSSALPRKEDTL